MTPAEFIKKWKPVALTERAAAHTHFLDLCKLFGHPDPVSADPTGEWFTFEKGATKTGGGEGFADVWKRNFFAWEYKKKKRDLNAAMDQLVRYAAALENPPLQVVCDTDRFIVRTAWTNTVPKLEVGPEIVHGIEINAFAAELARTTIWIGDIQWRRRNGIYSEPPPILRKLDAIECRDALMSESSDGSFVEAEWPSAEFIVGNPPFLGSKFFRKGRPAGKKKPATKGLGDAYTEALQRVLGNSVPGSADLCVYWFSKCEVALQKNAASFGLVATKGIAKGTNNAVLKRIFESSNCRIFDAWTNEEWIIDGAEVRVALVCVLRDPCNSVESMLNGKRASTINSDLTEGLNFVAARSNNQNAKIAFQGVKLNGPFEVNDATARQMIAEPTNVNGEKNSRVLKRFIQNDDVTERPGLSWVVDFSDFKSRELAPQFQSPFELLTKTVLPYRNKLEKSAATETAKLDSYWLMQRPRPKLRSAIRGLSRCILVPETSEHRIFVWGATTAVFSGSLFAIAREDDTSFGILCSRFHDGWATAQGNRLGVGNQRRYNATRTFETFPFPEGLTPNLPAKSYENDPRAQMIAKAAKRLDELRNAWLNPSELVKIEPEAVPGFPDRILAKDAQAAGTLKTRTLTNLYNQDPQWLADAHRGLDAAVAAAYGWSVDISEEDALANLLKLNLSRASLGDTKVQELEMDDAVDDDYSSRAFHTPMITRFHSAPQRPLPGLAARLVIMSVKIARASPSNASTIRKSSSTSSLPLA
jgi:hypothetical protein